MHLTEMSARLLTVKSCYLENHSFLMSEPAEKPPLHLALVVVSIAVIVGLLPHLQDKQAVGIGSGSTIVFAVERIGR